MQKQITFLLFSIFLILSIQAIGQQDDLKELTLRDAFQGSSYPERLSNTAWQPGKTAFTFTENEQLLQIQPEKGKKKDTILTLEELNKALKNREIDTLSKLPSLKWKNENTVLFTHVNQYITYQLKNKKAQLLFEFDEEAENKDYHQESKILAYTIGNNLYLDGAPGERQITKESNEEIVYGQEVHRREFGIKKGTFWNKKGDKLAFYRKDETMVADYPLVDIDTRIASLENTKYPMAGQPSHHVTIGVFDLNTSETVYLNTGEPKEQYLTNVTWHPNGKIIYVAVLNRDQNHLKLNAYNAENGEHINTLFEEKHKKYVEPENGPVFLPWNDNQFLWYSERDNYQHLYLYNTEGELQKQITSGNFDVLNIDGFNEKKEHLYVTTTKESPVERHLYSIDIEHSEMQKITEQQGTHKVKIDQDGEYFLDVFSNLETGSQYTLRSINDNKIHQTLVESNNPLKENYKIGKTEIFTIKAADDQTDLYCRMIKPHDFDESKKYPALIYVYGGPHAQLIQNTYLGGGNIFLNYMANQGYIVFTVDNRGTANRGLEFENIIHRNVGEVEVADQMKGVDYLKNQPFIDTNRIGVDGWSYGGFMTISMLLDHPQTFKVGVAGGPVIDWQYYEVMYGERYMDTPLDNPEGYESANLVNKAGNLDSRLLVIHGTKDPVVVWQHSLKFLKAAIKQRKMVDYFVYPGHEHNVSGIDRLHLYKKIEQYFNDHL
ncbi:MAG: DPP IV N-terminal domain-containing protein [Bacteroidales bacterium]